MTLYSSRSPYQIAPNLYLGDVIIARSQSFLHNAGIRGIINTTTNQPNAYPESYDYFRVSIYDDPTECVRPFFQPVFDFIQRHHNAGYGVSVHCQMGISRSATLVIAYLMMDGHKTLGEAFRQVKSVRQQIDPNEGFIKELRELERSLFGRTVTLERLTFLDRSIEAPSNYTMDLLLNVLVDLATAFGADASKQTLETLTDQLLKTADNINRDQFSDILCRGVCKCVKMFGGLNSQDQQARAGIQQGLSTLCTFYKVDINACLDNLTISEAYKDLCIDVPLANRWLNDLRSTSSPIDTSYKPNLIE